MPSVQLSAAAPAGSTSGPAPASAPDGRASAAPPSLPAPIPRDARLIALILASQGITDAEPAVLHMILEFAQRYLHDVMSDALVYADHAASSSNRGGGPSGLTMDDVQLAIQSRLNHSFTQPPSKDMLLSLAEGINSIPLPAITERYGLRLPPPEQTLTNVNFNIVPHPPPDSEDDDEDEEGGEEEVTTAVRDEEGRGTKEGTVGEEDGDDAEETVLGDGNATAQRGTKRSLEEDEDYD